MSESKVITSLHVLTDSENGYEHIGDIDGGGFDEQWLMQHIKTYGTEQLLSKIAYMNWQVYDTMRKINAENDSNCKAVSN